MKNKGMLFPIALVVAIIISATSMALAATSPLDGLGITIPSVGSDITIPSVGSDITIPADGTTIPADGTTIPADSTGGSGFTEPTAAFTVTQTTWKTPFNTAIPVLNKNTCERLLNIIIFRNNFISLSTFTEYESRGMF